jgi:uncharacterized protein involved in response to NO
MLSLHRIEEPARPPTPGFALWQLGFRPFYLLASCFAAISVPLWALQFSGVLAHPYLAGPVWHAHEMVFGFTLAVVVGFLFTAGRNWTGLPTPTGPALAALAALWVAGRVLGLTPWGVAAAAVNVAFPLAAAIALARPFVRSGNRRNYFFIGLLVLMAAASGLVHLAELQEIVLPAWAGLQLALDVVLFILAVMAGRVIPMFTNNGAPGAAAVRKPVVEKLALGSLIALVVADALRLGAWPVGAIAAVAFAAHLVRWWLWQPWTTRRVPLLWVLHLAYLWVPVHLALRVSAELGLVPASAAMHALGHTARPLRADRIDIACYVLVLSAAVVRVGALLFAPGLVIASIQASATLWALGFGLYALHYGPMLIRPRLDGKPG